MERQRQEHKEGDEVTNQEPGGTYTIAQAWELIGNENITRGALYLAAGRDFPAIRIGRRILIPRAAFDKFLMGGA